MIYINETQDCEELHMFKIYISVCEYIYIYKYKCADKKFKKSCKQSVYSLSVFITILVTGKSHITCVQHADSNALIMQKAKLRVPSAK